MAVKANRDLTPDRGGRFRVETEPVYELIDIRRTTFGNRVAVMRCSDGKEIVMYIGDKLAFNLDMEVTVNAAS